MSVTTQMNIIYDLNEEILLRAKDVKTYVLSARRNY